MIEANEINSTFYALRLLSHRIDTSEIEVTDGDEYPASEFTKEEQEQALNIIHGIEDSESVSSNQLTQDKIDFYVAALSNRIEQLANSDLANAGYVVERPYERDTESSSTRHQDAESRSEGEGPAEQTEDEVWIVSPMGAGFALLAADAAEQVARRHNFRPEVVNKIKAATVEACINISEHSLSSDGKIHVRFRVKNDSFVINVGNIEEAEQMRQDESNDAAEQRRGWGLKLIKSLMDEVEFEFVDEGTSLRS